MILQRGGVVKFPEQKHIELLGDPDRTPRIANPYDEEFDNGISFPAHWTISTDGIASYDYNQTYPSHIYVSQTQSATNSIVTLTREIPNADFSLTACVYLFGANSSMITLNIYDNGSPAQEGIGIRAYMSSGRMYIIGLIRTTGTQTTSGTAYVIENTEKIYLHVQKIGTTNERWFSMNGKSWYRFNSSTKTWSPYKFYLQFVHTATAAGHKFSSACDWVRYNWITL